MLAPVVPRRKAVAVVLSIGRENYHTHSKDIQDAGHPVVVDVSPIDCRGVFCYHLH